MRTYGGSPLFTPLWRWLPLCLASLTAHASTWDDIAALDAAKQAPATVSAPTATGTGTRVAHPPFMLRDGRSVRVEDWKIVLFMQAGCSYCQQFDPMLKALSDQTGIGVFALTLDGRGDTAFPDAAPAGPDVVLEFFGNGLPIATPTTFLVNVHTMNTYPLYQGAVDQPGLLARLDDVFQLTLSGAKHGQP